MIDIFFYGLFMDQDLLLDKGLNPSNPRQGFVDEFGLRIGQRATLLRTQGEQAYGVVMGLSSEETEALYSEESVSDYIPEQVNVTLLDGTQIEATCYNLPEHLLSGSNRSYADALVQVAAKCGLPDKYIEQIKQIGARVGSNDRKGF